MKNILITTDFTPNSEKSYALGAQLAKKNGASLTLYHSSSPLFLGGLAYTGFGTTKTLIEKHNKEIRESRAEMEKTLALPVFENLEIKSVIDETNDDPESDNTVAFINENDFDLVISGDSIEKDSSSDFLENLTNEVGTPVLIIKQKPSRFKEILITTDFKTLGAKYFKTIQSLAESDAKLTILYVNTSSNFMPKEEYDLEFRKIVNLYHLENVELKHTDAESIEDGILSHTRTGKYDLVTVATEGKSAIKKFFYGSVTDDLLESVKTPILSVNLNEHLNNKYESENMAHLKSSYIKGVNQKAFL